MFVAQRVSFGVVAGGYANSDFMSRTILIPSFAPDIAISDQSGYLVGVTVDVALNKGLSFAVDGLYKPLHYEQSATFFPDGSVGYAPATVLTWQFPVLAKYRCSVSKLKPFIEGGPSFRDAGNRNSTTPSNRGISAGAGMEGRWGPFLLSPGVRYTRWAQDPFPYSYDVRTQPNQVEFLFRILWGGRQK